MSDTSLGFLLSRRWIGFAIFVMLLAALCVRLGFWQLDRLHQRLDRNDVTARHLAADPVPLGTVLRPGQKVDESAEWTRVRAVGVYDVAHEVTVKFTTRDGAPGVDVVTPLVLEDGAAILVDRGWLPTQNTAAKPSDVPAPPSGEVTVTGWLRPDSGADDEAVRPVDGQVRAISSDGLAPSLPGRLYGGYLNLRSQEPAAETSLQLEPKPELGQGPHFFYALQWWFFALLALIGYVWFARDERNQRKLSDQRPSVKP